MSPDLAESCPLLSSELSPADVLPGPGEPPVCLWRASFSAAFLPSQPALASEYGICLLLGNGFHVFSEPPADLLYRSGGFALRFAHALFSSFKRVQAISPLS